MMNIIGRAKLSKGGKAIILLMEQESQGVPSIPLNQLQEIISHPETPLSAEIRDYTKD